MQPIYSSVKDAIKTRLKTNLPGMLMLGGAVVFGTILALGLSFEESPEYVAFETQSNGTEKLTARPNQLLLETGSASAATIAAAPQQNFDAAASGGFIREYLLANPEVIVDALRGLKAREDAQKAKARSAAVAAKRGLLNANIISKTGVSYASSADTKPITIVEFVDFKCGYCRKAHTELNAVVASNPDVRLIVKQYPILGPESVLAAKAAYATLKIAGASAYETFADELMLFNGPINEDTLRNIWSKSGIHSARFAELGVAMGSPEAQAHIDANSALGRSLGINGTPAFVINDQLHAGYLDQNRMNDLLGTIRTAQANTGE